MKYNHFAIKLIPRKDKCFIVLVDKEDVSFYDNNNWYIQNNYVLNTRTDKLLHRLLLKPSKDVLVDHINRNPLDNRRNNLRCCNNQQNTRNSGSRKGTSSYKGVFYRKDRDKWCAQIQIDAKSKNIGTFDTELEAAQAYNVIAFDLDPKFCFLNEDIPEPSESFKEIIRRNFQESRQKKSKYRGVSKFTNCDRWFSRTNIEGKMHYLGSFETEEKAYEAIKRFKEKL